MRLWDASVSRYAPGPLEKALPAWCAWRRLLIFIWSQSCRPKQSAATLRPGALNLPEDIRTASLQRESQTEAFRPRVGTHKWIAAGDKVERGIATINICFLQSIYAEIRHEKVREALVWRKSKTRKRPGLTVHFSVCMSLGFVKHAHTRLDKRTHFEQCNSKMCKIAVQ